MSRSEGDSTPNNHTTGFHVDGMRRGEPDSFARLYERISPSLQVWARLRVQRSLRGFVEPDDVVQEVWWRTVDGFHRFDPEVHSFRAWLFQIATNLLLEWNRQRQRIQRLDPEALRNRLGELPPVLAEQATSVSQRARLSDSVAILIELVQSLPAEDRAVFTACGLEGLTAAEAASVYGQKADTINKRWRRLREKLSEHPVWREFDPAQD